jgi:hypothetical protein
MSGAQARMSAVATRLCAAPLLLRADSGFCSQTLLACIAQQARALRRRIDVLIKWNPRSTPVEAWAQARRDDPATVWRHHREGKRSCVWQIELVDAATRADDGHTDRDHAARRASRLSPDRAHRRQARQRFADPAVRAGGLDHESASAHHRGAGHRAVGEHDSGAEAFAQHYGQLVST